MIEYKWTHSGCARSDNVGGVGMAKRSNQKRRLLYISKILSEQTDEAHAMTLARLLDELAKYDIEAERKTLYDDIEELKLFGLDVCVKRDRHVRYYVGKRDFSLSELKVFSHALRASNAFGEKEKRRGLRMLSRLGGISAVPLISQSRGEGEQISGRLCNEGVLQRICEAMISDKMLRVKSFEWNSRKQRILDNEGQGVLLSPWHLELEPTALLVAFVSSEQRFKTFRLDRILELATVEHKREGEREFIELYESRALESLLDVPEATFVRLRCSNGAADEVVGRYGSSMTILSNGEESFECSIRIIPDAEFFSWLFLMGRGVRILSPESALREYERLLREASDGV